MTIGDGIVVLVCLAAGYWFVEFDNEVEIKRSDTTMAEAVWFGCLTAGLVGRISKFDRDSIRLMATNEPIVPGNSDSLLRALA